MCQWILLAASLVCVGLRAQEAPALDSYQAIEAGIRTVREKVASLDEALRPHRTETTEDELARKRFYIKACDKQAKRLAINFQSLVDKYKSTPVIIKGYPELLKSLADAVSLEQIESSILIPRKEIIEGLENLATAKLNQDQEDRLKKIREYLELSVIHLVKVETTAEGKELLAGAITHEAPSGIGSFSSLRRRSASAVYSAPSSRPTLTIGLYYGERGQLGPNPAQEDTQAKYFTTTKEVHFLY